MQENKIATKKIFSKILAENKWIIIASLFFLIWKFFLISVLWDHRLSAPKPDDSYVYITHIENIKQCPSVFFCENTIISKDHPLFFSHLTYGAFFGTLSNVLGISSEQAYHLSFYIGTLILLPVLILFLGNFTKNKRLIAFSIFFFALYNGGGSYHGFFWVVPSFFALMFFFLIFSLLAGNHKHWKLSLAILIPAAIYTHMLALYLIGTLFIFVFLKSLVLRKFDKDLLKRSVFILIITAVSYFSLSFYFSNKNFSGNHHGVENIVSQTYKNSNTALNPEKTKSETGSPVLKDDQKPKFIFNNNSYKSIRNNYLKWIYFNFFGLASFVLMLLVLAYYKQTNLLLLYFSSLIFVLASIPYQYGYRSLILIWPVTFLIYAFGSWHCLKLINEKMKNNYRSILLKLTIFLGILIFSFVNLIYSYCWNRYSNYDFNLKLDSAYADYLKNNSMGEARTMYGSKVFNSIEGLNNLRSIPRTENIELTTFYVTVSDSGEVYDDSDLDKFLNSFSKLTGVSRGKTAKTATDRKQYLNENFLLAEKFGDIEIYKRR